MKLGFTGTRKGMTDWQKRRLRAFLRHFRPTEFHHGDCKGADEQAHRLVEATLGANCRIVIHPCDLTKWRAGMMGNLLHAVTDPLTRNANIVAETDELVAAPESDEEQLRSGTWQTIRLARRAEKRVEIIEREQPALTV